MATSETASRQLHDVARLVEELRVARARNDLLAFMQYAWWNPFPFKIGRHTRAICDRLTRAVHDWKQGKSTYLIITVPFRHGKSDIVSRALPAWFLGVNADMQPDVIMTGYGADLIEKFSRKAMGIIQSPRYQRVFPGVVLGKNTAKNWNIAGSVGEVTAVGLGGAITGSGGNLIVIDDYCKSRAEAVSETFRNKVWDAFRNDVFTRQNRPACIFCVTATPWHVDDLIGRIRGEMAENKDFPEFETLCFPAHKDGPNGWQYLFPEHFPATWYENQRAVLGRQAAALLDCDPVIEGGERFDVNRVQIHTDLNNWPKTREMRAWDLASSAKERDKDDPDWTWGIRGTVTKEKLQGGIVRHELWIRSMVCCQAEAPERDRIIRQTVAEDGIAVHQAVEAFGAYKDTYTLMKAMFRGAAFVEKCNLPGDKSAKAAPLEAIFDAGLVHVYLPGCAACLDRWREDFSTFPNGRHDDAVDATAILFAVSTKVGSMILV